MSTDPPTYEEAVKVAIGVDENTTHLSEVDDMNVDAGNVVGISRGDRKLETLPHYIGMGRVYEFFTEEVSGEEAKNDFPLSVEDGHRLKNLIDLCNEMQLQTTQKSGFANTANTFMHPAFQKHFLMLNRDTYKDLDNLHALRAHSMKHILERCLEKWNKPDEVITELLNRVFGVMCVVWDLLSKENSLLNQVNSQAAGLSVIEERMNNVQLELQSNLFHVSSNLLKAENIANALAKLEQAESSAKQLEEMKGLNKTMKKMGLDVGILAAKRQEDVTSMLAWVDEKLTLDQKMSDTEDNLQKYKAKHKEVLGANSTMHDNMIELQKENGLAILLHEEQKRTIEALQGAVAAKDVTIAALQQLLQVTIAQQGQNTTPIF